MARATPAQPHLRYKPSRPNIKTGNVSKLNIKKKNKKRGK